MRLPRNPIHKRIWPVVPGLFAAASVFGQLTLNVAPSDHNGYNISCFGGADGAIDLSVSGGTPPYTYTWSTGATTEDVTDLRAGFISVVVRDANANEGRAERTLTEPHELLVDAVPYVYGTGYNVSCFSCFNGSIAVTASDGVTPYTYLWSDGATTEDRTLLDAGSYEVYVTDANGCLQKSGGLVLTQPERDDWTKSGNAGTVPGTHYIGTSDNKDVVFKSNGAERFRLLAGGDIKVPGLAANGCGLLYVDGQGVLKKANGQEVCTTMPWLLGGNVNVDNTNNRLGTNVPFDLIFVTDAVERMRLTTGGRLGLGNGQPVDVLDVHHTDERGGLRLTNDRSDANAHSEIRFMKGPDGRYALGCDFDGTGGQDFFLWDHVAGINRLRVDAAGRVLIGNAVPQTSALYKLYVEGGIVSRDVKVTANNFPDYVFRKDYALLSLEEVAGYIDTHGHLPHMPSAAEVDANAGVEVGDLQLRLLRTVEEQQLYILQLREEVMQLKERVAALQKP